MTKLTGKQVRSFWKYMQKKYDFKVIDKDSADEMALAGWALEQMGVQSKKEFLERYTTTLSFGGFRRVYIPFELGVGTQYQLQGQFKTCVHECQHIVQADRDPAQQMKYLMSDSERTLLEVDAYRTNLEVHYWLTGKLLSPTKLANVLKGYGVRSADIRVAAKHLTIAREVVKYGGVTTGTSKVAIRWLKRNVNMTKVQPVHFVNVKV